MDRNTLLALLGVGAAGFGAWYFLAGPGKATGSPRRRVAVGGGGGFGGGGAGVPAPPQPPAPSPSPDTPAPAGFGLPNLSGILRPADKPLVSDVTRARLGSLLEPIPTLSTDGLAAPGPSTRIDFDSPFGGS